MGLQQWQQHSKSGGNSTGKAVGVEDGSVTVAQTQLGREKRWVLGGLA